MTEYMLFLDESKPNTNFCNFTLGGIIVEKTVYETRLKPLVESLKTECFGCTSVILHEIDIRRKEGEFVNLTREKQELFFNQLKVLFQ